MARVIRNHRDPVVITAATGRQANPTEVDPGYRDEMASLDTVTNQFLDGRSPDKARLSADLLEP